MFNRSKKKEPITSTETISNMAATPMATVAEISGDIIAVITATIATMEGNGFEITNGLIVRRISRISGIKTTWANAGLLECIDSRKI